MCKEMNSGHFQLFHQISLAEPNWNPTWTGEYWTLTYPHNGEEIGPLFTHPVTSPPIPLQGNLDIVFSYLRLARKVVHRLCMVASTVLSSRLVSYL